MRALVQRVKSAQVEVEGSVVGAIDIGLLVFVAALRGDEVEDAVKLANKVCDLRIFEGDGGGMDLSVADVKGDLLLVSQFTLAGRVRKGRRPEFLNAERPERALELFDVFIKTVRSRGFAAPTGTFQAHMEVSLINDGPVTLMVDTDELSGPRRTS